MQKHFDPHNVVGTEHPGHPWQGLSREAQFLLTLGDAALSKDSVVNEWFVGQECRFENGEEFLVTLPILKESEHYSRRLDQINEPKGRPFAKRVDPWILRVSNRPVKLDSDFLVVNRRSGGSSSNVLFEDLRVNKSGELSVRYVIMDEPQEIFPIYLDEAIKRYGDHVPRWRDLALREFSRQAELDAPLNPYLAEGHSQSDIEITLG